jgi:hypothetical protein
MSAAATSCTAATECSSKTTQKKTLLQIEHLFTTNDEGNKSIAKTSLPEDYHLPSLYDSLLLKNYGNLKLIDDHFPKGAEGNIDTSLKEGDYEVDSALKVFESRWNHNVSRHPPPPSLTRRSGVRRGRESRASFTVANSSAMIKREAIDIDMRNSLSI